MKVYIAAAFHRRHEMREVASQIRVLGITVTSRWLDEQHISKDSPEYEVLLAKQAQMDADDLYAADTMVRFSDDLSTPTIPSVWGTGSRFEETGMAHALGKKIIIVGGKQSLFDRLPKRIHLPNVDALINWLYTRFYLDCWEAK
jgi:hypothetical protein